MKHLKLFENSFSKVNLSKDEIEDHFLEYIDEGKGEVKEGFISKDNRYFTDVANVTPESRKCIKVVISLDKVANGVIGTSGNCLTDIDIITRVLSKIKTFYLRTELQPNFLIKPEWDNLKVEFYIPGEKVESTHLSTKEEIKGLLTELLPIIKRMGYKRVALKSSNWFEVRTPQRATTALGRLYGEDWVLRDIMRKAQNGEYQNSTAESRRLLHAWCQKVAQLNYRVNIGGGDNQVVFKLQK
jgi:hypothetical protein